MPEKIQRASIKAAANDSFTAVPSAATLLQRKTGIRPYLRMQLPQWSGFRAYG